MNYEIFKSFILENVKAVLGFGYEEAEVTVVRVAKNNQVLDGINVKKPDARIAPTVYTEEIFEQLTAKYADEGFDSICERGTIAVADAILKADEQPPVIGVPDMSFEACRDRIVPRIIGTVGNDEYLKDKVVWPLPQGAGVIFIIRFATTPMGPATATVTNSLLDSWGITAEELYAIAVKNVAETSYVTTMGEVLGCPEMDACGTLMCIIKDSSDLTNGGVLSEDIMHRAADRLGTENIILIPSSIYEFIVVDAATNSAAEVAMMVAEINEAQVKPQDRVVNAVFGYDFESNTITGITAAAA